ncbi:MAG: type II secretion system protein GspD [Deltaproteobacteria bacterium HGW-Deltaproteobacteria-15]|jgi:general secretion pathway protein D|nr:MAG: type II secretion system protein GspD [Deltaproteobacteria bacterium HGW-Deltaproteobacteria-15]
MTKKRRWKLFAFASLLLIGSFAFAVLPDAAATEEMKEVTLDFDDVDIRLFIRVISEMTGKNFIIDNNVRGKVTVLSPRKLTTQQAYEVFKSVLTVNGFTVVEAGQIIKVVPAQNMSGYELPLGTKKILKGDDEYITQIMPLVHLDANGLVPVVKPLLTKNGAVFAPPSSDILVVTDHKSNLKKVGELLEEIDIDITGATAERIDLKYSTADVVSAKLTDILDTKYGKGIKGARAVPFRVVPLERVNAIIGVGSPTVLKDIRSLIPQMDARTPEGRSLVNVYYLEHAKAEDMVGVLTETQKSKTASDTAKSYTPTTTTGLRGTTGQKSATESISRTEGGGSIISGKFKAFGKETSILADKSTNSIVVYAEPEDYLPIKEMIQKLDIPRKQVFIEALIMEVSPDEDFSFGTEWFVGKDVQNPVESSKRAAIIGGSTNIGSLGSVINSKIKNSLGSQGALEKGFSLGILGESITVGNLTFPNLSVLIRALETLKTVNILSKPQLMTLNNEKAMINISTNTPFKTSSTTYVENINAQTENLEYRDVGIKLEITPRINNRKKVTLEIKQEVSKFAGTVTEDKPTTLKRAIDTVVEVNDGGTIVIGGLIEEQKDFNTGAVPCLGGIPFLGWAFKSVGVSSKKTNLLVFISPRVFDSSGDAENLTGKKREILDNESINQQQQMDRGKPFFMGPSQEPKPDQRNDLPAQ